MTNLVVLHSGYQIKQAAALESGTATGATGFEEENLMFADRNRIFKSSTAVTSVYYIVDMNTAVACDYVYLQRADLMARDLDGEFVYINVDFDDNTSFTSPQEAQDAFNYNTSLVGPHSEDFIMETGFSGTERYFRAILGSFTSSVVRLGGIMFGPWFDPGCEPQYDLSVMYEPAKSTSFRPRRKINLVWSKVSGAIRTEFELYVNAYRQFAPVVLYDRNDYIFDGEKCINCKLVGVNYSIQPPDLWTISAEFEELI